MKKVLIITYYWPPSGGSGVQRWLKITKYLSRQGIECHVITVDETKASYPSVDLSMMKDIPEEITVYRTDSFEPIQYYEKLVGKENVPKAGFTNVDNSSWKQKLINALRSNFFIPDPRKGWNSHAYKKAVEIIQKEDIKTVITTSPPHSTQLVGRRLKRNLGIHWISDLRDPWTDIYYYKILQHSVVSHMINKKYEKSVVEEADQIITVGEGMKTLINQLTEVDIDSKIHIIENGFDHEDFELIKKEAKKDDRFRIVYTGLLSEDYGCDILIEVLKELDDEKITLQFVGNISESVVNKMRGASVEIEEVGYVPHDQVIHYQKNADALLLIIPQIDQDELIITGKIFEYIATGNPIIGIGPQKGDAAIILEKSNAGKMFNRTDESALKNHVVSLVTSKINTRNTINVEQYTRMYQASKVAELIT